VARQLIADAGTIPQLIAMIKSKDTSANGKVYACGAAHNIGHSDKLKQVIFDAGAVPAVLDIISSGCCGGKSIFIQLLVVLCMNVSLRQPIADAGVSAIIETCRTGAVSCQEYAVFLLGLFLTNAAIASKCAVIASGAASGTESNGIAAIVRILSDLLCNGSTVGLQSKAAMALSCAAKHAGYKDFIGTCTEVLVKIVALATPAKLAEVTSHASAIAATVSADSNNKQKALAAHDEEAMQNKELEINAAHALLALSQPSMASVAPADSTGDSGDSAISTLDYSDNSKYQLLNKLNELGAIPAYVNILACTSGLYTEGDKDKACAAIGALCYPSESNALLVKESGGVEALVLRVDEGYDSGQANGCAALYSLAKFSIMRPYIADSKNCIPVLAHVGDAWCVFSAVQAEQQGLFQ